MIQRRIFGNPQKHHNTNFSPPLYQTLQITKLFKQNKRQFRITAKAAATREPGKLESPGFNQKNNNEPIRKTVVRPELLSTPNTVIIIYSHSNITPTPTINSRRQKQNIPVSVFHYYTISTTYSPTFIHYPISTQPPPRHPAIHPTQAPTPTPASPTQAPQPRSSTRAQGLQSQVVPGGVVVVVRSSSKEQWQQQGVVVRSSGKEQWRRGERETPPPDTTGYHHHTGPLTGWGSRGLGTRVMVEGRESQGEGERVMEEGKSDGGKEGWRERGMEGKRDGGKEGILRNQQ
ncbi:Hypothetical_protein [Hexamita inflata]|uniref:Hypothetical_protein n=1 Tax=Hexamita inflata TaxID=28002 RepID=A0AA86TMD7_9EUKA|nr:Hypothetical protein HINF_LOCUS10604 [Hexamita inflata]